jgi:hypothetical protein
MRIRGRTITKPELLARMGRLEQVGGLRRVRCSEGPEDGTEVIEVRTGAGLEFDVHPHRGMDIVRCELFGASLAWLSPAGAPHPAYYDESGMGWLRTAAGGLLMTCGLSNAGPPCVDEGESHGIHGRAHHTAAREVSARGTWNADDHELHLHGEVRETRLFGENLVLRRAVHARLGENRIHLVDEITNEGFEPAPLMLLYHFNFGYPLLDEHTEIQFPSRRVEPRDATTPLDGYDRYEPPQRGYVERVYYHHKFKTKADKATGRPWAEATLRQPRFPVGPSNTLPVLVRLRWTADTLPSLVEWKMPRSGVYALGIEPANCDVAGRAANRKAGKLQYLGPNETVRNEAVLEVVVG